MRLPEQLTQFGFVGERKAVALICLCFYATIFSVMALIARDNLPEWMPCFVGLAACYVIGFFAVAADWFWGRWFAVGLGYSGLTMALMSIVATHSLMTEMVVFGVMHGLIAACLLGERMAAHYEAKLEWRQRWNLDDQGVVRIQRSVTRAAASLPTLIMWALAPREGAAVGVLALGVVGVVGLLRGRTWGVLAVGGAGLASLFAAFIGLGDGLVATAHPGPLGTWWLPPSLLALYAGLLLSLAAAPFARPILAFVFRRRLA
jgi:hypothetical protein